MSTLQTCDKCGHTGPVRYDNRKHRRCEACWERVESETFDGVLPEEQAIATAPAATDESEAEIESAIPEPEAAAPPAKSKKGK